jgi:hypothetical protein
MDMMNLVLVGALGLLALVYVKRRRARLGQEED